MLSSAPYDFFGTSFGGGAFSSNNPLSSMDLGSDSEMSAMLGIDPQLVGSPAPQTYAEFDSSSSPSSSSQSNSTSPNSNSHSDATTSPSAGATSPEESSGTASSAIAPVKVGGHGKARKGTVVSGGIKKASASSAASTSAAKENTATAAGKGGGDDEDDDDDLPADWRPPPEVFQKMSSKEKRQLRNKISARNFRVRRKEYISTLEDNIAERDRLLSAIRSELGSTQSENLALRQEIAALKRTLLEGRGPAPVLPPPAPLSPSLGSITPSLTTSLTSTAGPSAASGAPKDLPAAHTLKDVGASSSAAAATSRFWQGHGLGMGGYTSVHTARIPELLGASPFAASPFAQGEVGRPAKREQENLNPLLNVAPAGKVTEVVRAGLGLGAGTGAPNGSEAFGDANPFTVRSLDAYRMHLWGRMAAHSAYTNASGSASGSGGYTPLSGLAGGLRPKYFASPAFYAGHVGASSASASSSSVSSSSYGGGNGNGNGGDKATPSERETAMYAALASQTLLRRLGGAFWEAFSGAESKPLNAGAGGIGGASGSGAQQRGWDAEKVRKVLEGKAVVRVVDVEPPATRSAPASPRVGASVPAMQQVPTTTAQGGQEKKCGGSECAKVLGQALEESMRSLSLGKK
ncbi:hypothetical protein C8F04DRAFT_956163 [Mycena alexandri]|uniref:BZIP domain-containing protein n=1 Tax=Mycena alexandri TaxID=1745969 RepID=A0AAD6SW79_9AGAR|nr:hypothetical protein C8F04DRAFT_956163 [Mycena alexandri]